MEKKLNFKTGPLHAQNCSVLIMKRLFKRWDNIKIKLQEYSYICTATQFKNGWETLKRDFKRKTNSAIL